jgi:hypothetical protein
MRKSAWIARRPPADAERAPLAAGDGDENALPIASVAGSKLLSGARPIAARDGRVKVLPGRPKKCIHSQ